MIVLPSSEWPPEDNVLNELGIVVGVARLPHELEPPAALFEELHHLRGGVHVLTQSCVADEAVGDRSEIFEHPVGVGNVARLLLRRRAGNPDASARQRGGSAEVCRLLHDERVESGCVGGERGGHAAAARADDEHVDRLVEFEYFRHIRGHGFGTAVRTANPAINSGAAR